MAKYIDAANGLRSYAAAKQYGDILGKSLQEIDADDTWKQTFAADEVLRTKLATYVDSAEKISPTNDKAIQSLLVALHSRALEVGALEDLKALAQTATNTAASVFTSRLDQQTGDGASKAGTTSLTSSAGSADLIQNRGADWSTYTIREWRYNDLQYKC